MAELAKRRAAYEDLYAVPENMTGEIIDGELVATPRPSSKHNLATFALSQELGPPFYKGHGGPGGWIFLIETEIRFDEDNLLVPDLAGWKVERFPGHPETNWLTVPPDWVCEILSPSSVRADRTEKMPTYARYGVGHIWLVDPVVKMVEVFRSESGRWLLLGTFAEDDKMRAEPFDEIEIGLNDLWLKSNVVAS